MSIQQSASEIQCRVGQVRNNVAADARKPCAASTIDLRLGVTVILQHRSRRAEVLLERDQPGLIDIRASQIHLLDPPHPRVTNHPPEEKGHAAKTMQRGVRAAVLVNEGVLER